jgi:hypothetical protein
MHWWYRPQPVSNVYSQVFVLLLKGLYTGRIYTGPKLKMIGVANLLSLKKVYKALE